MVNLCAWGTCRSYTRDPERIIYPIPQTETKHKQMSPLNKAVLLTTQSTQCAIYKQERTSVDIHSKTMVLLNKYVCFKVKQYSYII